MFSLMPLTGSLASTAFLIGDYASACRLASFWFGNLITKVIHFVLICSFLCNFHPHCILPDFAPSRLGRMNARIIAS